MDLLLASLLASLLTVPSPAAAEMHVVHVTHESHVAETQSTQSPAPTQKASSDAIASNNVVSGTFISQVEQYVLQGLNKERTSRGLAALRSNTTLATVARAHSSDMLANNYFAHNDLSGCTPGCRATKAGYSWRSFGENILWMSGYNLTAQATAQKMVTDWMNSPGHRANILNSTYTEIGVGIAQKGTKIDATTDFGLPR